MTKSQFFEHCLDTYGTSPTACLSKIRTIFLMSINLRKIYECSSAGGALSYLFLMTCASGNTIKQKNIVPTPEM